MTGTGTQADPYKPTTWAEFLSCTTAESVYTELPVGGGVFDMNTYYPEGIPATIPLKGFINGNGWEIRNAYWEKDQAAFQLSSNETYGYIENLNFINGRVNGKTGHSGLIGSYALDYSGKPLRNCKLSGRVERNGADYCTFTRFGNQATLFECSMNLMLVDKNCTIDANEYYDNCTAKYCKLELDMPEKFYSSGLCVRLDNSYITGHISHFYLRTSTTSVFDCEIDDFLTQYQGTSTNVLVNTDKFTGTLPSGCIGVTTAQLKDAAYLSSIGFPIQT